VRILRARVLPSIESVAYVWPSLCSVENVREDTRLTLRIYRPSTPRWIAATRARRGQDERERTISHQHTGLTDLALTAEGDAEAIRLGQRLQGLTFAAVLTSPLKRAVRRCELAGFGPTAEIEPDLRECELRHV